MLSESFVADHPNLHHGIYENQKIFFHSSTTYGPPFLSQQYPYMQNHPQANWNRNLKNNLPPIAEHCRSYHTNQRHWVETNLLVMCIPIYHGLMRDLRSRNRVRNWHIHA